MQTACGAFIEKGLSIFVLSFKNKSVHNYCILAISMIFKTSFGIVRVMQKFTIVNICLIVVFVSFCVVVIFIFITVFMGIILVLVVIVLDLKNNNNNTIITMTEDRKIKQQTQA